MNQPHMHQYGNSKVYEEIQRIVSCIHRNASLELREHFVDFSKKVFSNETKTSHSSLEDVEIKIAAKVENTHNRQQTKLCKNVLHQFMKNSIFEGKHQILEMLLKLSQLIDQDIPQMFQTKKDFTISSQIKFNNHYDVRRSQQSKQAGQSIKLNDKQYEVLKLSLVKQLFYVFTNTNSEQIVERNEGYQLRDNIDVKESLREIVNDIADLGWLHRKIIAYQPKEGVIKKAFRQAIQQELKQFYLWNNTIQTLIKTNQISMRKLYILSFHPLQILKWLAILVDSVEPFDGCHIISLINSYRPSGLSVVNGLINRLIAYIMRPLLNYIKNWMYMGELLDERNEFFIKQNKQILPSQEWEFRYQLVYQNIPDILTLQSACKIFDTGKSINFLRNVCKVNYNIKTQFVEDELQEQYLNSITTSSFMNWLTTTYNQVTKTLVQTLFFKFNLKYHLMSFRYFFLLGKGDFIQHLYDILKEKLSQKNKQISQHSLHGYISDAISKCFINFKIKNQNNYYRNEIVDRLLPKKIHFGNKNGFQGWDFFNFQYSFDRLQPLLNIFSSQTMLNYQKIFNFLWKIKQIKQILKDLWVLQSRQGSIKVKRVNSKDLYEISHYIYLLRNSMCHFITNLDSYLMVAIESSWNRFWQQMELITNFDDILKIHHEFQQQILQITLRNKQQENVQAILNNIFTSIINFKVAYLQLQQNIDEYCFKLRGTDDRLSMSKRSILSQLQIQQKSFAKSYKDIKSVKLCFDEGLKHLYTKISYEKSNNLSILKAKLNFSQYYSCLFME